MKILSKLAILALFIACISSCQKEKLPTPISGPSTQQSGANQRSGDPSSMGGPSINANDNPGVDEIVSGGDDDRDGGGGKKKPTSQRSMDMGIRQKPR